MNNPIKYISFFDLPDSTIKRNYVVSCSNKMAYIAKAIAETGNPVEIVSVSAVTEDKFKIFLGARREQPQNSGSYSRY